ncbi:MAG: carboxypeptidase-like regulatory domain-containing protein [Acidobacteriaceae bacterium]
MAQAQQAPDSLLAQNVLTPDQPPSTGTISGRVVDQTGNFVVSAVLMLVPDGHAEMHAKSNAEGRFTFPNVPVGAFELDISAPGFAVRQVDGVLHPGETQEMLDVAIDIAGATTEVQVSGADHYELAEEQIKVQETQRVLGVIPNFYVTYDPNALSLRSKQKFELAWKSNVDPVTFASSGFVAGLQQATDGFNGYGQGSQGYAKRFAASYADTFIGNMIGGAILPSILKQDPRYFYKGTGSIRSRVFYALATAVICKGDNGRWQPDYSGILGSLAAGGISNLYYPAKSRNGAQLTFENTLLGIAGSGIGNIFQEFVVRKLTPRARNPQLHNP